MRNWRLHLKDTVNNTEVEEQGKNKEHWVQPKEEEKKRVQEEDIGKR